MILWLGTLRTETKIYNEGSKKGSKPRTPSAGTGTFFAHFAKTVPLSRERFPLFLFHDLQLQKWDIVSRAFFLPSMAVLCFVFTLWELTP